ncbi:hypothetical protein LPIBR_440003 [Lacticaseibacillus paracasei]|nr:hypothetical protein LPIBR_440003 [Lacticaseibacillus paracasei]
MVTLLLKSRIVNRFFIAMQFLNTLLNNLQIFRPSKTYQGGSYAVITDKNSLCDN